MKKKFKVGDVVVWQGYRPSIGKIIRKCKSFSDSWSLNEESHDSCCEGNLRKATIKEVKLWEERKGDDGLYPIINNKPDSKTSKNKSMPEVPTQEDWINYLAALQDYSSKVSDYADAYDDNGENPLPPRPPRPPRFDGWLDEE